MARLTQCGNEQRGFRLREALIKAGELRVVDEVSYRLLDICEILLTPAGGKIEMETCGNSILTLRQFRDKLYEHIGRGVETFSWN
jgi:hypothetical protein